MVRKQHKILCLVLCLTLIVMSVIVGTVNVFAATGDTVYVRVNNGWSNLHCYMWTDGQGDNQSWPGAVMTKVSDDVYSYKLTGDFAKIIFNNGNSGNGNQTSDMTYPGHGKIYDLQSGQWSDYSDAPGPDPTSATTVTNPNPTEGTNGITVYFKNTENWDTVNCYMWNGDGNDKNASWPGLKMTSVGDGIWMYTSSKNYAKCIFNNGSTQTDDLTAMDGYVYDFSTKSWEVYDTSDLRVTSYTADPSSDIYPETEVTLKATASNKNGAEVSYRFSVSNAAGGTSVISDFSSVNTAKWTPTAAGTYTIIYEFKDTEGNENSRTLSLKVEDDSSLSKPVIKSVSPADLNLVKVSVPTTVSVKAGGGKTGTNLLFYKYVVTDPNGVKNTPYYTLNNTYSFTPKMKGDYTVQVYVQNSDNTTINKTYTYTATTGDVPTPTQPSTGVRPTDPVGIIKGDANRDGIVDITDATYVQKHIAEYDDAIEITLEAADMNDDGDITIVDATQIQILINSL